MSFMDFSQRRLSHIARQGRAMHNDVNLGRRRTPSSSEASDSRFYSGSSAEDVYYVRGRNMELTDRLFHMASKIAMEQGRIPRWL